MNGWYRGNSLPLVLCELCSNIWKHQDTLQANYSGNAKLGTIYFHIFPWHLYMHVSSLNSARNSLKSVQFIWHLFNSCFLPYKIMWHHKRTDTMHIKQVTCLMLNTGGLLKNTQGRVNPTLATGKNGESFGCICFTSQPSRKIRPW